MLNFLTLPSIAAAINSTTQPLQKIALGYSDILDFIVINLLVFAVLVLLKKTRSMPVLFGVIFLGVVYGLSSFLNLHLTHTLLNTFFGMFLIFLAIIFQDEIKRLFELIGFIGLRRKINAPKSSVVETVLRSIEYLSDNKIGALVVFSGRENLNRQLEGGVLLDGKASFPLLLSIFSSATPGHDGAVIIEGNKIKKFAVHLPLSESREAIRKYGTRHRAAIGISERTDALTIVVSEESGNISIAQNKKLYQIKRMKRLEQELQGFLERKFPKKSHHFYQNWIKNNFKLLSSSFVLSLVFWLFFSYQTSIVQKKFTVPLQFKGLSQEDVVENYIPEDTVVVFSGRESDLNLLKPDSLKASIDLSGVGTGWHQIIINQEDIEHPPNISVINIEPASVRVSVEKEKTATKSLEK